MRTVTGFRAAGQSETPAVHSRSLTLSKEANAKMKHRLKRQVSEEDDVEMSGERKR
jgi:hypothetical protein